MSLSTARRRPQIIRLPPNIFGLTVIRSSICVSFIVRWLQKALASF